MNKTSKRFAVLATVATVVSTTASAFALTTSTAACDYTFNTNLKAGSRSADVMKLQKVLNADSATSIGNAGKETNFFGPATLAAVKKFQRANGITPVSGFVGALTRAELNQVCSGETTPTTPAPTDTGTNKPVDTNTNNNNTTGLDNSQPAGTVFQGQAAARIAVFTLTGNNTVNAIELTKIGVSSNDLLQNVYLYVNGARISDSSSVNSSGKILFSGLNLAVNGSLTLTVRADLPSTGNYVGQSVGVALTGVKNNGETAFKAITGVSGNMLNVGSGSFNTVTLTNNNTQTNTNGQTGATVNAGSMNQVFHEVTLAPGSRAAVLKSVAYRFIGSVNQNSDIANLSLYVNNTKVSTSNVGNNSYVTFDLSRSPVTLNTGSNNVQLRGDIIGGSTRNFQFSMQYAGDLLVEDSQVPGFGLAVTGLTNNLVGKYVTVGNGSLVINQNPAFTVTKLTSGATNQTIGSWTFTGYGDTTKVETLAISVQAPNNLQNVSLYVNGGQIGSQYNMTGTVATTQTLTYNLGSNLVTEAGKVNVVELKADLRDSNGVNTPTGSVNVSLVGGSSVARTTSQFTTVSVSSQASKSLTVGGASANVSKTVGFLANSISPNTTGAKIGSITLSNDDNEDLIVNNLTFTINTDSNTTAQNISNVRVSGATSSQIYSPLSAQNGDYNFSINDTVSRNTSRTYDVLADVGSVANNGTITVTGKVSYRGNVSNVSTTTASTVGVVITFNTGVLSAPVKSSDSLSSRAITGTASRSVAKFTLKATGGAVNVNELWFTTTPSDYVTAITVSGIRQTVVSGTTKITGLNINVPNNNSGADVDVMAEFSAITGDNGSLTGQSSALTSLTLVNVKGRSGNNDITVASNVSSNAFQVNGSIPSRVWITNSNSNVGAGSSNNVRLGTVNVSADAAGDVNVKNIPFNAGLPTGGSASNYVVRINGSTDTNCTIAAGLITCSNGKRVSAGQTATFDVYADIAGVTTAGNASLSLGTASSFTWDDVKGNAINITGANVNGYNN